jgi:hypothetical protein
MAWTFLHRPVRFAQDRFAQDSGHTERSAAYELEVYGTDGEAISSSVWEELGRAGFQDYIDVYTQTAYDCYRIVVNSMRRGEDLVNTGLQMLMLPPVQNVVAQHSFTGSPFAAHDPN